jgi:alkylation response protein AidB-like acyl-CoA dehydrogenase
VISVLDGGVEIADGHASADTLHGDWADEADILLAAVGDLVIAVDRDAPGIVVQRLDSIDRCRQPATVRLDRAPIIASFPDASRTVSGLRLALTAAEMLGVTQRALEISRTYAEERHQFGVAIATFQAVRHRLARMAVGLESLRSACYLAQIALAGDRDAGDPVLLAMVAKAHAASTGREILEDALQVHGGVGFTAEHELSALFARALSLQGAVSDERDLTRAIARHALDKRRGAA